MTRTEAQSVLDRMDAGEQFDGWTLKSALAALLEPPKPRGHGWLPPAPPGCVWDRPAPGWVDLKKVS